MSLRPSWHEEHWEGSVFQERQPLNLKRGLSVFSSIPVYVCHFSVIKHFDIQMSFMTMVRPPFGLLPHHSSLGFSGIETCHWKDMGGTFLDVYWVLVYVAEVKSTSVIVLVLVWLVSLILISFLKKMFGKCFSKHFMWQALFKTGSWILI